jgi:hypothetical protein
MHHTGNNLRNQFGPVIWISVQSLWLLHDRENNCLFVRILPTAAVKMVDKSWINETYFLMPL